MRTITIKTKPHICTDPDCMNYCGSCPFIERQGFDALRCSETKEVIYGCPKTSAPKQCPLPVTVAREEG